MAVVYHEIYLPIDTESTFDYIVIKQGDAGTHKVRATLISNNRVYTIPTSGASYFMKFRKPDNNYCLVEATVSDNTISAEVTEEMLRVSGTGRGEFMIVSGSDELKTATFHVKIVRQTFTSGDVQSHSDFAPFAALLQGAGAAASNANTAAAAANAAASLAEQKAQAIPDDYSDLVADVAGKADKSTTYTKTQVDQMIADVEVETDTTLAVSGAPADSAETGRQISLLKADLDAQTGVISLIKNYYIRTSDTPISLTPIPSTVGRMYAVVDCTAGDKFVINAYSNTEQTRAWCFIDSTNNAISMAEPQVAVTDLELTAPTNAVKLIINDQSGGMSYKVGNNLASKIGSGLSDNAKAALLECIRHIARWDDASGQAHYATLYEALYGVPLIAPVFQYNPATDGLLSTQDYVTDYTILDGATQSIVNNKLRLYATVPQGGTGTRYARYIFGQYDGSYGRLKVRAKITSTKIDPNSHVSGSLRVEVSDSTHGAQFFVYVNDANDGLLGVDYVVGSTRTYINTEIEPAQYHDYEFIAKGETQKIVIDGVTIANVSGLSTSFIGGIRLWATAGGPNADVQIDIDSIEFYDEEV